MTLFTAENFDNLPSNHHEAIIYITHTYRTYYSGYGQMNYDEGRYKLAIEYYTLIRSLIDKYNLSINSIVKIGNTRV